MNKISNYDKYNYNYKEYWNERTYEDKAEKIILEKYLKNEKGNYFIDIGGSFGRNLKTYYNKYKNPIILDYSLKTLQKNEKTIKKRYPNVQLIAANAYQMPFKSNSMDGSMMIRVLHHIEDPEKLIKEINRVLKNNSVFILEFANKMHIKAVLKWFFSLKLKNFSKTPYQQPNQNNFEGSGNQTTIFLNFHLKYILEILKKCKFKNIKKTNCSFFRTNIFKKYLPLKTLIILEKTFQKLFSWTNLSPSIITKNIVLSKEKETEKNIFCCPICKKEIILESNSVKCSKCKKIFQKKEGVWDFRV